MIDPIGAKTVSASDLRADSVKTDGKVGKVAQIVSTGTAAAANTNTKAVSLGSSEAVQSMAVEAPVNEDRVSQIKKAVQEGKFPIYPSTIADRLIAFEQGWRGQ